MLIEDIKSLRLAKAERSGWKAVSIETHNKTVRVGEGLSAKSLEWLQLCILREISASALQHAPCRPPAGPSA